MYKGQSYEFKIVTLEDILSFFAYNKNLLQNKLIKIETKDITLLNKTNIKILADIINKFPTLSNNIIHLSFYPLNLIALKNIQKRRKYSPTRADLLCDYKQIYWLSKIIKSIDLVSLRIKMRSFPKMNSSNSKRVNKKIFLDTLFMKFSNAINDNIIKEAIKKYGSVGIYVLNTEEDIKEFCSKITEDTFLNYYEKIYFTTDNPLFFKNIK